MLNNHRENKTEFGGDKKVGTSLLSRPENKLKHWVVPKIPRSIETYHLTMTTLLWSAVNVVVALYRSGQTPRGTCDRKSACPRTRSHAGQLWRRRDQ